MNLPNGFTVSFVTIAPWRNFFIAEMVLAPVVDFTKDLPQQEIGFFATPGVQQPLRTLEEKYDINPETGNYRLK